MTLVPGYGRRCTMKVEKTRFLEDCFDGTIMREVTFDVDITEAFIYYLQPRGTLQYFPDFPKPFFIFEEPSSYTLKGACGNRNARIILGKTNQKECLANFSRVCEEFAE